MELQNFPKSIVFMEDSKYRDSYIVQNAPGQLILG